MGSSREQAKAKQPVVLDKWELTSCQEPKFSIYNTIIRSVVSHDCETWVTEQDYGEDIKKLGTENN